MIMSHGFSWKQNKTQRIFHEHLVIAGVKRFTVEFSQLLSTLFVLLYTARDDKYWGGHFGSCCSAACIRVKSEVTPASGDGYSDIQPTNTVNFTTQLGKMVHSLYDAYDDELKEMQELIGRLYLCIFCFW